MQNILEGKMVGSSVLRHPLETCGPGHVAREMFQESQEEEVNSQNPDTHQNPGGLGTRD